MSAGRYARTQVRAKLSVQVSFISPYTLHRHMCVYIYTHTLKKPTVLTVVALRSPWLGKATFGKPTTALVQPEATHLGCYPEAALGPTEFLS